MLKRQLREDDDTDHQSPVNSRRSPTSRDEGNSQHIPHSSGGSRGQSQRTPLHTGGFSMFTGTSILNRTLKKISREVTAKPKRIFQAPTDVYLEDWWLSKPNGVKGISVSGCPVEKRRYKIPPGECDSTPTKWIGPSREFHSTEVVKRHSSTTVETSNGLCVHLCGLINRRRSKENGFSSEVLRYFVSGFPFLWADCATEIVAEESSQSNHDHFTETVLPAALNTYNGAQLHDMVLTLTDAEREILNKKMFDDLMGMLNPETASGKSSKPNPSFVKEEILLTPTSSTAKVKNKQGADGRFISEKHSKKTTAKVKKR